MKKVLSSILIALTLPLFSTSLFAQTKTDAYSYYVVVLPPFGKVLINDNIECPNADQSARCLAADQAVGSVIKITGTKDHSCYLTVNQDGTVAVDEGKSIFCTFEFKPASDFSAGQIRLQKHF